MFCASKSLTYSGIFRITYAQSVVWTARKYTLISLIREKDEKDAFIILSLLYLEFAQNFWSPH